MNERKIVVKRDGVEYSGRIGTIKSTMLGFQDHGIMTAQLVVEWPGGGVAVGGYRLDESLHGKAGDYSQRGTAYGLDQIIRIIETVGVESWEQLKGQQVVVLFDGDGGWGAQSVGIASTVDESKVFILSEHAKAWRDGSSDRV